MLRGLRVSLSEIATVVSSLGVWGGSGGAVVGMGGIQVSSGPPGEDQARSLPSAFMAFHYRFLCVSSGYTAKYRFEPIALQGRSVMSTNSGLV